MTSGNAYKLLIERYRTWMFGMPDSEDLIPALELRMTPEDALFLSQLPFMPHTMEQLTTRLGMSADELYSRMLPLIGKGLIMEVEGRSAVRYTLTDSVQILFRMPGWKGEQDDVNRALAPKLNRYYIEHMGADFTGHPTKVLRAIPIARTIQDTRTVLPYEDILVFVDHEDYHTVSTCACRHRHNLDPNMAACKHETATCLHFGRLGRFIVKHGMGKPIEKAQTMEILKNAADAGLVHGISNYKQGMDTICNCCSCCCLFLEKIRIEPPNPRGHQRSNYVVEHKLETCKACGLCARRCPMGALELKDKPDAPKAKDGQRLAPKDLKEIVHDPGRCIGCGVCAHKCPTQSLKLVRRGQEEECIPNNMVEAGKRLLLERGRDPSKIY
jgi:Na+-translocating ferredoxin:NAD+ oxidoreductase subunit B